MNGEQTAEPGWMRASDRALERQIEFDRASKTWTVRCAVCDKMHTLRKRLFMTRYRAFQKLRMLFNYCDDGNGSNGGGGAENTFTLNNAPATSLEVGALDIFVVNQTLTATSGIPAISQAVEHITSGGNRNATYNVFVSYFIVTEADYVGKFKNGVVFTNGSTTLDWNTMETATEF